MDTRTAVTEILVPSDAAQGSRVRRVVSRLASGRLRSSIAAGDVELAVGEAFSNAVKYGSGGTVSVRIRATAHRELAVELTYSGEQFDTRVKRPDVRAGIGGFGCYIMHQVLDGVEYSFQDGHTIVRMCKRRT